MKLCNLLNFCSVEDGSTYRLTEPRFWDYAPEFDPDGKFIYFLSYREFNPHKSAEAHMQPLKVLMCGSLCASIPNPLFFVFKQR
jgi:WD40-like Beta Propeller Repeat